MKEEIYYNTEHLVERRTCDGKSLREVLYSLYLFYILVLNYICTYTISTELPESSLVDKRYILENFPYQMQIYCALPGCMFLSR